MPERASAVELAAQLEAAESALASIRTSITDDPAASRVSGALLVKAGRFTDAALRRYNDQLAIVGNLTYALVRAQHREAEAVRRRLTFDDVRGATMVRDRAGWHKVVRVSAKSVTVETDWSWTDRIPLDKILEARSGVSDAN